MTFKDVVVKNFKFNIRKYFAYFLCSSFSITILFMYSTLLFNDNIVKEIGKSSLYNIMKSCIIIIGVFCFFFISYVHSSFVKSRSKEFGLFLTLGMTKRDISKLIKIENSIIIIASSIFGLLFGSIFSRIFFMIAIRILNMKNINFNLNYKSYILTLGLFLLIYIAIMLMVKVYISKLEVSELLRYGRKADNKKVDKPILGAVGIVMVVGSFLFTYFTISGDIFKDKQYMIVVYMCSLGMGLYFIIAQFTALKIKLLKNNKTVYFKKILSLNQINYKFNQYKKILYIVSLLSGAAIFFMGLTFGLYVTTKDLVMKEYPYDIMYVETFNKNKISESELIKIVDNKENPIKQIKKVNFSQMYLYKNYEGKFKSWSDVLILSESEANKILKKSINVERKKAITITHRKEIKSWCKKGETIKLNHNENDKFYDFVIQDEINEPVLNYAITDIYESLFLVVLNDEDYKNLDSKKNKDKKLSFYLLNFKSWKKTENTFNRLMDSLKSANCISKDADVWKTPVIVDKNADDIESLRPINRLEAYDIKIQQNGFTFFVMSFMGLLFLLSSGIVLYFKMYTDIEDEKIRYNKLYRIGITSHEIKDSISKELKPMFFIPLVLGGVIGIGYIHIVSINYSMHKKLLVVSVILVLIYFMLQTIFYFITKRKYLNEILE